MRNTDKVIERLLQEGATMLNGRAYTLRQARIRGFHSEVSKLRKEGIVYTTMDQNPTYLLMGHTKRRVKKPVLYVTFNDMGLPPQNDDTPFHVNPFSNEIIGYIDEEIDNMIREEQASSKVIAC